MRILVTNDDGVSAPGLAALLSVASKYGEVKFSAPEKERSGCGHAMTLHDPLRVKEATVDQWQGVEVNGVPVDCVNVGLTVLWPEGCDLILSGFNNGPNLGFDVTYSGTVAGAMEGCTNGIRSISLSMASLVTGAPLHWKTGERWLAENWEVVTSAELPERTFLNVNIPNIDFAEIRGERLAKMGTRIYEDRVERREDPWGRTYYWQGGVAVMKPDDPATDVTQISNGFVSITPIKLDWTCHETLEKLKLHFGHPLPK